MNEDNRNYKDNRLYLYSAIGDMYLLKNGDIFIGTLSSHFSKTLFYIMIGIQLKYYVNNHLSIPSLTFQTLLTGNKMRVPPFISLDLPAVCDVIDWCSDDAVMKRMHTMEEIVYRYVNYIR